MKPYSIAAIGVLLFAFCSVTVSQNGHMPERCCFKENYLTSPLPQRRAMRFETTSPSCTDPGIIFHTVAQKQICANPSDKWVKRLMKFLQKQLKSAATESGSGDSTDP
ncbi:hypothetical protein SRHO_G00071800 [Serrasalmus rhombeus]